MTIDTITLAKEVKLTPKSVRQAIHAGHLRATRVIKGRGASPIATEFVIKREDAEEWKRRRAEKKVGKEYPMLSERRALRSPDQGAYFPNGDDDSWKEKVRKWQSAALRGDEQAKRRLQRYGATGFLYGWNQDRAIIGFHMHNRQIKFVLQMPDRMDEIFWMTPGRHRRREESQAHAAWEQATRQRWRVLALAVKAKLEAVEAGIATFDAEFLPYIVLPGGETVADFMLPQIESAYATGKIPKMLPALQA